MLYILPIVNSKLKAINMTMRKFTITLTPDEWASLKDAVKSSGLRTKSEFIRLLISRYLKDEAK